VHEALPGRVKGPELLEVTDAVRFLDERLSGASGIMGGRAALLRRVRGGLKRTEEVVMREGRPKRIIESLKTNAP